MNSLDHLSDVAKTAHRAFIDMGNSKKAHFNYLESIETKYKSGGAPSEAEKSELDRLLSLHDKNVAAFTAAMSAVTDAEEKKILFQLIS